MALKRIHVTGGPEPVRRPRGQRLGELTGLPVVDIDGFSLKLQLSMPRPLDLSTVRLQRVPLAVQLAEAEAWLSEGSNLEDSRVFFERAELVVYVDCRWSVASYRILSRHVKASLSRNNRFPGWRRLYRFWRWSAGYYAGRNPHSANEWGTPHTRTFLEDCLREYESKLTVCRTKQDVEALVKRLAGI